MSEERLDQIEQDLRGLADEVATLNAELREIHRLLVHQIIQPQESP